jgi:Ca2+-binding EF-hand superfamily protein
MVAGFLVFGLLAPLAFTQGPGGFRGRKGMGGGGDQGGDQGGGRGMRGRMGGGQGGNFDWTEFAFASMAGKDKDGKTNEVIIVSEIKAPPFSRETKEQIQAKVVAYQKRTGGDTTRMTKEQFKGYNAEQQAERSKQMAKGFFDRMDKNKDGKLSKEEVQAASWGGRPSPLLADFDKYDTNKDGFIDEAEFGVYIQDRQNNRRGAPPADKGAEAKKDEKASDKESKRSDPTPPKAEVTSKADERPLVFRYGKLPTKELPSWFIELDTDKDGQVGLYEWRAGKRDIAEFKLYDTNRYGFITAEELLAVLRIEDGKKEAKALTYVKVNAEIGTEEALAAANSSSAPSSRDGGKGAPGKGGFGKGGFGKGGMGKGGFGKGGFGKGGQGQDAGGKRGRRRGGE